LDNIEQLIKDLNWQNPEEVQKNAMNKLEKISEEEVVLLARQSELCNKSCWHNAAIVLKKIGYPRIRLAIPYLMEWFRDANWPGAMTIFDLFKTIDVNILLPYLRCAAEYAIKENDTIWGYWLIDLLNQLNINTSDFNSSLYNELLELKKQEERAGQN